MSLCKSSSPHPPSPQAPLCSPFWVHRLTFLRKSLKCQWGLWALSTPVKFPFCIKDAETRLWIANSLFPFLARFSMVCHLSLVEVGAAFPYVLLKPWTQLEIWLSWGREGKHLVLAEILRLSIRSKELCFLLPGAQALKLAPTQEQIFQVASGWMMI